MSRGLLSCQLLKLCLRESRSLSRRLFSCQLLELRLRESRSRGLLSSLLCRQDLLELLGSQLDLLTLRWRGTSGGLLLLEKLRRNSGALRLRRGRSPSGGRGSRCRCLRFANFFNDGLSRFESEARKAFQIAVAPLALDNLSVGHDLGGAPGPAVLRVVGGAFHVVLALEGEGEDATAGLLILGGDSVDEAKLRVGLTSLPLEGHATLTA